VAFLDPIKTHHTRYDSSGQAIGPWLTPLPDNTQHSEWTIHVSGTIRTCNPSKQAAAGPHLRPRGHWDRLCDNCVSIFRSYSVIMKRNSSPSRFLLHLFSDLCVQIRGCTFSASISCILQMLLHEFIYLFIYLRVMMQVIICRPFTAENRIWCQAKKCVICNGKSGNRTGFLPSNSVSPCQYHFTNVPYPYFIHTIHTLYNLSK